MAIFRLEAKIIGRATQGNAVGAASYRSGGCSILSVAAYRQRAVLKDERQGITFDYSRK